MKRKVLSGCFGVVAFLVVIACIAKYAGDRREAALNKTALNKELALARAEGLPTTWQEFAATIKPAKPEENAAKYYQQLRSHRIKKTTDPEKLDAELNLSRTINAVAAMKSFLAKNSISLELADQATSLPRCWFDRDWSLGPAVLLPELADMKQLAKLVLYRADVAAAEGRVGDAINDANRARMIGSHAAEEGTLIDDLVGVSIHAYCLHHVALWRVAQPKVQQYRELSEELLRSYPKVNLQKANLNLLIWVRDIVEMSESEDGLRRLGVKKEYVASNESLIKLLINPDRARVDIALSSREIWEALGLTPVARKPKIEVARQKLMLSLVCFPTASSVVGAFGSDDAKYDFLDEQLEAQRLCEVALSRALSSGTIPKTIKTDDLKSPYDSKPIEYKFDGRQIVITASCTDPDNGPKPIKLPSDQELKLIGASASWKVAK